MTNWQGWLITGKTPQHQEENINPLQLPAVDIWGHKNTTEDMAKTLHQKGQNHTQRHQNFLDRRPYSTWALGFGHSKAGESGRFGIPCGASTWCPGAGQQRDCFHWQPRQPRGGWGTSSSRGWASSSLSLTLLYLNTKRSFRINNNFNVRAIASRRTRN